MAPAQIIFVQSTFALAPRVGAGLTEALRAALALHDSCGQENGVAAYGPLSTAARMAA